MNYTTRVIVRSTVWFEIMVIAILEHDAKLIGLLEANILVECLLCSEIQENSSALGINPSYLLRF